MKSFELCKSLTLIKIPSSVTLIGYGSFQNCSSLRRVLFEMNSSVSIIDNYAFDGCSSLKEIKIPSSVKQINDYAFRNCISLTKISIPLTLSRIGKKVFEGCSVPEISIPSNKNQYRIQIESDVKLEIIKNK